MLKHFITAIARNIWRYRNLNLINIIGFSVGMASCLIIGNYVIQEYSFDRHHKNFKNIYRVGLDRIYPDQSVLWAPIAPGVRDGLLEAKEILDATRVTNGNLQLQNSKGEFFELNANFVDSSFFNVFTIPVITGNVKAAINDPRSAIITKETAEKFFPGEDAMGKTLTLDRIGEVKVGAIIENCSPYSHMEYDMILSLNANHRPQDLQPWGTAFGYYTYILVSDPTKSAYLEEKYFPAMAEKYLGTEEGYEQWRKAGNNYRYFLQPLGDIHLHSNSKWEIRPNGNAVYVNMFLGVGILILLIACINFTNLSSARFSTRIKEVGMRKILGSYRKQIIIQFLMESVALSIFSMLIALLLVYGLTPIINDLTSSAIDLSFIPLPLASVVILIFTVLIGFIAGIYPAVVLSSFKPIAVLNNSSSNSLRSTFRDYLVVAQFAISFILVSGSLIIDNQMTFLKSADLGYKKEKLLVIDRVSGLANKESFKNQAKEIPGVVNVALSADVPGRLNGAATYKNKTEGNQKDVNMTMVHVDMDVLDTWGVTISEGRPFAFSDYQDTIRNVILNETAAIQLGLGEKRIGAELLDHRQNVLHVVGIVKDFHLESLHRTIRPMIMFPSTVWINTISVKIATEEEFQPIIASLDKLWKSQGNQKPFTYFFLEDEYRSLYSSEDILSALAKIFSVLAILLASLGLFGLSSFSAEQKTREIGIRKVLGATAWNILYLFVSKTYRLILIAIALAFPITHYFGKEWLSGFAYRTSISYWLYIMAGFFLLALAVGTVLIQSYKTTRVNPAQSLKAP